MNHQRTQKQVLTALLVAVAVVMGRFFLIPIPWTHGNVNLCDLGIMIAALMIGPLAGGVVGGLSGMILDLISGCNGDWLLRSRHSSLHDHRRGTRDRD